MEEERIHNILRRQPQLVNAIMQLSSMENNGATPEDLIMCASVIHDSMLQLTGDLCKSNEGITMYSILQDLIRVLEMIASADRHIYPGELSYACSEVGLINRLIAHQDYVFEESETFSYTES